MSQFPEDKNVFEDSKSGNRDKGAFLNSPNYTQLASSAIALNDRSRSVSPFEVPAEQQNFPELLDETVDTTFEEQEDLAEATSRNPTIVLELDMDCNVRFLSKNWESIVGTKIKKILNKPVSEIVVAETEFDKNVFSRALEVMTSDDLSYRVKFITYTNISWANSLENKADVENEELKLETGTDKPKEESDNGSSSIHSAISTDGGLIEIEGQGILIHDLKTQLPTHSMWILRPFQPIDVTLELPLDLIEKLGSGIDIFESYLQSLNEAGIIDMEAVPAPRHVLCRICEQQVPAWWLERHSEICLVEHKLEDQVRSCHECLIEHKKLIISFMEGIAHSAPASPNLLISSPFGSVSGSSPNTSSSTISSMSSASSASSPSSSSPSSPSSHSKHKSILQYKGFPLPLPKPASSSAPVTSSPLSSTASSTVSTPVPIRNRTSSIFGSMRFPLKNLERLVQYCSEALSINPGELRTKADQKILDVAYSPNSEKSIKYILSTTLPISTDPAIRLLTEDTEALARDKVDAIERLASSLQYSEKLKNEIDQLVLLAVTSAVEKIRGRTTSFDNLGEEGNENLSTEHIFTDSYIDTDNLPATPFANVGRSITSPLSKTSSLVEDLPRSETPKIQIGDTQVSQTQTPDMANDSRGRRSMFQQSRTVYLSPRRPISPAPVYFSNSPMASLQRNTRRHRDSGVSSSTPTSSPLLTPNDLPIQSAMQRSVNLSSSISNWDSSLSDRHSSTDSTSKLPLSPLLVSSSISSKQVTPSIKDYEIIKPISKGAFGSVYLTRRRLTGDYFAIKVLKKSDMIAKNQVPNVKAERAIMMRQSDSPYVAQLYSSFQSKDYLFLVMEYLNGGDTASLLKMLGTLSVDWAKRYIAEVIVGVDDLHKKGIVHRDLKPDNLLIDNQGHLKLTDFGLSRMGLVGRQKNIRKESVADSNSIFDALQQNSGSAISTINRNHKRASSITPFSLSPNLERASLSIPSKAHPDSAPSFSPSSPPTPSSFEHLIRNEGIRRSSSNASNNESPLIRPLMTRSSSQTSFAILDDIDTNQLTTDNINNPYALFDPQTSTQARKFVGTPDYLAPETIEGVGQDEVSDWWSIGCILFEFLFGYPPFHASTAEKVFENILKKDIDWPHMSQEQFDSVCTNDAKDLIEKLLVKDPSQRLGFNGTQEIKDHPFFKGISWDTLFSEEASFIPVVDDPESTDYFDSRGADNSAFPAIDDEPDLGDEDEETDYEHDISDSLDFSNATKTTSPTPLELNRSDTVNLLGIHISDRERRSSKLSEINSAEFGSFQFRNLAALDRANKDQINRLKSEHVDHRGSFSSSTSSVDIGPLRARGYSTSGNQPKRPSSASMVGTPSRSSFSSGSPNMNKLGYSLAGSISGDENNSALMLNDSSGRNSPLQNTQQSRSTDSGSPIPRILKQTVRSTSDKSINQQQSPQYPAFKALGQPFQDYSPSSSDNEESRNSAILRVRKRRSTRRLNSESTENSENIRRTLITYDVLLCEPIPILRESTKIMLQKLGCAVVAIKDGDELIRRATGEIKFDFIVTAMKIPKINAVDVVKLIKNTATVNSDTPIITITAYYKEAKMSGVFDYVLEKPINSQLLADALNRLSIQKRKITQEAVSDTEGL